MSLGPGTRLGRYEIRSKIGAGGMGEERLRLVGVLRLQLELKLRLNGHRRFLLEWPSLTEPHSSQPDLTFNIHVSDLGRVTVKQSVVNLSGPVETAKQKAHADRLNELKA